LPIGQKGMSMFWAGTIITKQGCLWRACYEDDPQFGRWNRVILAAEMPDTDGNLIPLWPDLYNQKELDEKRQDMGAAAFAAEYLNNPGRGAGATFELDQKRHGYSVDGDATTSPLTSMASCKYYIRTPSKKEEPQEKVVEWGPHVSKMYRMMTVDYASTTTRHSDYSCIAVLGFERPADVLWILDIFAARVKDPILLRKIWEMGNKWRVSVVGVESVSVQTHLSDSVSAFMETMSSKEGWMPRVVGLKPPHNVSKQDKMGGMQWRFSSDRIRLPFHLKDHEPFISMFQQFNEFRVEARDGGLMHDDILDAISMYQQMKRSKGSHVPGSEPKAVLTPLDSLMHDEPSYKGTGLPAIIAVNASDLPNELVKKLMYQAEEASKQKARDLGVPLAR